MQPMDRIKSLAIAFLLALACASIVGADESALERYIAGFDRQAQQEMKIDSAALVAGVRQGRIQVVDIRFRQEIAAYPLGFGAAIPMDELPARWAELPKDKLLVTVCPVKDRAIIAMVFLKTKGFQVKYLNDGLTGLAQYLRENNIRL
jgi:rhodanese-related sulfurtransferase